MTNTTKAALLLLALALAPAARALDPRYTWQTLQTPHFEIHFHQGELLLAQKLAQRAERAHDRLSRFLEHWPTERCQVVLQDDTDFSNGNASPLLYNTIHAFAAPPDARSTLNDFDDWITELIEHEYTHIEHLDTVEGLPAALDRIFGKLWIPNGAQPLWFTEGLAVYAESDLSAAGRVRSAQEEMVVRLLSLEDRFPRLDQLSNLPLQYPRASLWYTIGGRFLNWVGHKYGAGALRDLSHDYGSRTLPLALNLSAQTVLGKSYLALYDEFRADEIARAQANAAQVRAQGETRPRRLTALGELVRSPRFAPDGRLVFAHLGADRLPDLRALPRSARLGPLGAPPEPSEHLTDTYGESTLSFAPDGRIVYSRPQVFQEFETVEDLYSFDPRSGDTQRLTRGLRAREPSVAKDSAIAFIWRRPAGRTALAILEPGSTEPRVVYEDPDQEPLSSPRFSPSGDEIAFVVHRQGSWDLRLIGRDGSALRDITFDRAIDRDPSFTPDGQYVLFASDRGGNDDLYAWRRSDGALLRITHLVSGGFEPEASPDGRSLAFVMGTVDGFDLGLLPLSPESWEPVSGPTAAQAERPAVTAAPPEELFPVSDYSPWKTLRPHFWLPYAATDAFGTTLGAFTSGFDVVGRHTYALSAWYGVDSRQPGVDAYYQNDTQRVELAGRLSRNVESPFGTYSEIVWDGRLAASLPLSEFERAQVLTLEYQMSPRSLYTLPAGEPAPREGRLASLYLQWQYSDARRFVNSISREQGSRFSVLLRGADPALGSNFTFGQASAQASHYFGLPWSWNGRPLHHALAFRVAGGIGRGDLSERHRYGLGGFSSADPLASLYDPIAAPPTALRGFAVDSFIGEEFLLGSAEYRFPLASPQVGMWTLPLFLRRLHGAGFIDVGDAFSSRSSRPAGDEPRFTPHTGVGAELRAELVLGYALPVDLRLGCGRGLSRLPQAALQCFLVLGGEL